MAVPFAEDEQRGDALARGQGCKRAIDGHALFGAAMAAVFGNGLHRYELRPAQGGPTAIEKSPRRDGSKPSGETALASPLTERPPRSKERLLGDIVPVIASQSARIAPQLRFVSMHEASEGGEVTFARPLDELHFTGPAQGWILRRRTSHNLKRRAPPTNSGNIPAVAILRSFSASPWIAPAKINAIAAATSTKPIR